MRLGKRTIVAVLLVVVLLAANICRPDTALADSPMRCQNLDDQKPITIDAVPARQRARARFLLEQAASIAARRGTAGQPVLIRLKSNDPGVVSLVAWVRDPAGGAVVLILYTSSLDQMHSLVDGSPFFVKSRNEPVFKGAHSEETGFSYQFYDRTNDHIHLSDSMIRTARSGKADRTSYRQTIMTGYSYGGLPTACRASGGTGAE